MNQHAGFNAPLPPHQLELHLLQLFESTTQQYIETHCSQPVWDGHSESKEFLEYSELPLLKKRRRRKRKKPLSQAEEELKRMKCLARNRIAASRCRQRKKEWVEDMEERMFKLLQRNSLLKGELEVLVDQTSSLKAALFEHSSCDFPALQLCGRRTQGAPLTARGVAICQTMSPSWKVVSVTLL